MSKASGSVCSNARTKATGACFCSRKEANCEIKRNGGPAYLYTSSLDKVGLDIGKTEQAHMTSIVFTTVENAPGENVLAGTYVGGSADASLGVGLGVYAVVGGSQKQIGLQPFSVEGVEGVNLALGLASLKLEAAQ